MISATVMIPSNTMIPPMTLERIIGSTFSGVVGVTAVVVRPTVEDEYKISV